MKIYCILDNLKTAVQIAERNTAKNQNLPVLNSVFIGCDNNNVSLRATNLENAVEISVPAKTEEKGSVVVSAKVLNSYLSNIKGEKVILQSQKNNLIIETENSKTLIRGYAKDDFPIFPKIDGNFTFSLPAEELKGLLRSVAVAASLSDIKPELSSLFLKMFKNTVKAAATDSFRLAEKTMVYKNVGFDKMSAILLPNRAAAEINRIFKDGEAVTLSFNKNQVAVSGDNVRFLTRLVEGIFPDYEQIIPKSFATEAVVKTGEILDQIRIGSVFSGRMKDITVLFKPAENKIILSVSNPDIGEHSASVLAKIKGEESELKFNCGYLMDGLSQMNSEYTVLSLNDSQSPMLIKEKGDSSFFYLAMPMRSI